MNCKSVDKGDVPCTEQATVEVFWPGRATVACDRHHQGMQKLATAMGFTLSSRPIVSYQKMKLVVRRTCSACGTIFIVSGRELLEEENPAPGKHFPEDCPQREGKDDFLCCMACDTGITECKGCRVKQDGQRS